MRIDRLISAVVAGVWLVAVFALEGVQEGNLKPWELIPLLGVMLVILALIWFGDELGEYTGGTGRGHITQTSPGCVVKFLGWVFLLAVIGVWLYSFSMK